MVCAKPQTRAAGTGISRGFSAGCQARAVLPGSSLSTGPASESRVSYPGDTFGIPHLPLLEYFSNLTI